MVKYPLLSLAQQDGLPELEAVYALPAQYEDSTHQLWRCESVDGPLMLKICNGHNVRQSSFWQGMSLLFDVQLPAQLGSFKEVYELVGENTPLAIPDYIASDSDNRNKKKWPYILAKLMPGSMVEAEEIDDEMVRVLAQHLSQLHSQKQTRWGQLIEPEFELSEWSIRLENTLTVLANGSDIPIEILRDAILESKEIAIEYAVPIMPDLRWDQFLENKGQLSTLVDLDAFVAAPRELELVLLEYLLTPHQSEVFKLAYEHSIVLTQVRKPYRLLLFLMNVLGEQDVTCWMESPVIWNE